MISNSQQAESVYKYRLHFRKNRIKVYLYMLGAKDLYLIYIQVKELSNF